MRRAMRVGAGGGLVWSLLIGLAGVMGPAAAAQQAAPPSATSAAPSSAAATTASDSTGVEIGEVVLGWEGAWSLGLWHPLRVTLTAGAPDGLHLEVIASDPDGNPVTIVSPAATTPGGALSGLFKFGRLEGQLEVRVVNAEGKVLASKAVSTLRGGAEPLPLPTRIVALAGMPAKPVTPEAKSDELRIVEIGTPAVLPADPRAYENLSTVMVVGDEGLEGANVAGLRDWVASGGHLVMARSQPLPADVRESWNWLPIRIGETGATVRELRSLETFAERNTQIPTAGGRVSVARLEMTSGLSLAASRDEVFLARAGYGLGAVTVLGLNPTQAPLKNWVGLPDLFRRMVDLRLGGETAKRPGTQQLAQTGVTDLASQVQASLDRFEGVTRASPTWVMGGMLLLLLVVGPLDYWIVHRVLKWPQATWITFPLAIVLLAGGASVAAQRWNGTSRQLKEIQLLDVEPQQHSGQLRYWAHLYGPRTERVELVARPGARWQAFGATPPALAWAGVPEEGYGGMYRPGGLEWNQAAYRLDLGKGTASGVPMIAWSSKAFEARGVATLPADLFEAKLTSSGVGRLSGTLRHNLGGPLEDWMIAYGNRVYRFLEKRDDAATLPLAAGEEWPVEQPRVFQRELKGYLTRTQTRRVGGNASSSTANVQSEQLAYDPLGDDPLDILRTATFHEEAGGTRYTRLTNHLLHDVDLSRQLRLGKAVLIGRVADRPLELTVDGEAVPRTESTTIVRAVFDVTRTGDAPLILPRLDEP